MIEAAAPKDELEGALAVQMACTHTAAMAVLAKLDSGFGTERRIVAFGSTAARLMKAYAMQMEVLRRLRTGGQQFVGVEHVHINDGGRAVIGNVRTTDSGRSAGAMSSAKVQIAIETNKTKRSVKRASKPRLSAPPKEPEMADEHTSIDSLDVLRKL